MHLIRISGITFGCCIPASAANAKVPLCLIKQETVLDAAGIQLSTFGKPMQPPPGKWEVVHRADSVVQLASLATWPDYVCLRSELHGQWIASRWRAQGQKRMVNPIWAW